MAAVVHFVIFVLIWPIAPMYLILRFDIDSLFLQFLIMGAFGPLALIGSSVVSIIIDPKLRVDFKERWKEEENNRRSESDRKDGQ